MERLKQVQKLELMEMELDKIKRLKNDLKSSYFQTAEFVVNVYSNDWNKEYESNDEWIGVNKGNFIEYLDMEVDRLERNCNNIISVMYKERQ